MKKPFVTTNPNPKVLIAWLNEAAGGGVDKRGMQRLCFEAALMLEKLNNGDQKP